MSRWPALLLILPLLAGKCDNGNGTFTFKDGGGTYTPSITYEDIGTICRYDPTQPGTNPSNGCPKSGMTCLIATADGRYRYGDFLYEAVPLFARFLEDGTDEGICTLVSSPGTPPPYCPAGTVAMALSSGHTYCARICESDAQCYREGYVCDHRLMDSSSYDPNTGTVLPLTLKLCVPACETDLPYCTRSFLVLDGAGGYLLAINDGDLYGIRVCNHTTGHCEDGLAGGTAFLGGQCVGSNDCQDGLICIGGMLFGAPPGHGFCAQYCNAWAARQNPPQETGCLPGEGCEFFLDIGYCFPDCQGNACGGANQVCQSADEGAAGIRPGQEWLAPRCIPCEMSQLSCGSSTVDAGTHDTGNPD